jgi:hypothetical protein
MKAALALLAACLAGMPCLYAAEDDRVVPAHQEPRHVPKLVNALVRVIDVEIPEGERTLFHAHALDYPYLMVTSVTLNNQIYGQEPKDLPITRGLVGYYRASTQGTYTHRFINLGPGTFRAIGIELLQPLALGGSVTGSIPAQPGLLTALDNERVRAYRIVLAPGQSLGPLTIPGPSLRVALTAGTLADQAPGAAAVETVLAPARFVFSEAARVTTLTNRGTEPVELVEFEFK